MLYYFCGKLQATQSGFKTFCTQLLNSERYTPPISTPYQPISTIQKQGMKTNEFFQHLRQLIADGHLSAAVGKMRLFAEKTPLLNTVLQQSGRLAQLR
jgi:hypothetical protein